MQVIENLKIKEKLYIEKLENRLTVMIIPKENTNKKYIMWGTNFGSIDNHFIIRQETHKRSAQHGGDNHTVHPSLQSAGNFVNCHNILSFPKDLVVGATCNNRIRKRERKVNNRRSRRR